jgi:hypothetical protein
VTDIWSDNVLSGQLARSCLWAALGPSMLPVLLLHLAYSVAQWSGLALMLAALILGFSALISRRPHLQPAPEKSVAGVAFRTGFLPALALLAIGAVSHWPESIHWEIMLFWIMILGFALRGLGWNMKILISLAWVVLFVQEIIERLLR